MSNQASSPDKATCTMCSAEYRIGTFLSEQGGKTPMLWQGDGGEIRCVMCKQDTDVPMTVPSPSDRETRPRQRPGRVRTNRCDEQSRPARRLPAVPLPKPPRIDANNVRPRGGKGRVVPPEERLSGQQLRATVQSLASRLRDLRRGGSDLGEVYADVRDAQDDMPEKDAGPDELRAWIARGNEVARQATQALANLKAERERIAQAVMRAEALHPRVIELSLDTDVTAWIRDELTVYSRHQLTRDVEQVDGWIEDVQHLLSLADARKAEAVQCREESRRASHLGHAKRCLMLARENARTEEAVFAIREMDGHLMRAQAKLEDIGSSDEEIAGMYPVFVPERKVLEGRVCRSVETVQHKPRGRGRGRELQVVRKMTCRALPLDAVVLPGADIPVGVTPDPEPEPEQQLTVVKVIREGGDVFVVLSTGTRLRRSMIGGRPVYQAQNGACLIHDRQWNWQFVVLTADHTGFVTETEILAAIAGKAIEAGSQLADTFTMLAGIAMNEIVWSESIGQYVLARQECHVAELGIEQIPLQPTAVAPLLIVGDNAIEA
jgi:hypothetical protein